jgi:hypothetical protein
VEALVARRDPAVAVREATRWDPGGDTAAAGTADVGDRPCRGAALAAAVVGAQSPSGGGHMSASCSAAYGEMRAGSARRRPAGIVFTQTYMSRRRVCAVGGLLRGRGLPMGGELALAALVVREHGVLEPKSG